MILALAIMAAAPAATSETAAEKAWRACIDRTTTNTAWGQCGGTYIRAADAALNAEWKRLMALVDGQTRTDLIAEERAWIAYRQLACKAYANGDSGREGQVLHYPGCVAGVIERRTKALAGYREFYSPR